MKNNISTKVVILAVSIVFLILSLFTLPIDFYKLVRIVVMATSIFCVYDEYKSSKDNTLMLWVYSLVAIVFNPILPFYLGKTLWKIMDVLTLFIFVFSIFIESKKNKKSKHHDAGMLR